MRISSPSSLRYLALIGLSLASTIASAQQERAQIDEESASSSSPTVGEAEGNGPSTEGSEPPGDAGAEEDPDVGREGEDEDEAEPAPSAPSQVDPYEEAKERVGRAEQLYADGNFDAALTEFERAFETMLGHPARPYVLYNIGRCQEKLYRYDDAIESYRRYLEIAGGEAEDRGTVEAKIELLEGLLGTLLLRVSGKKGASIPSYEVWVDGRLVGENVQQFLLPGGNHEVEVRAEGFESDSAQVQLPARSEQKVEFELSPLAKEYRGLSKTYFWAVTGLAAATAATSATFGVLTLAKRGDINQLPSEGVTQDDVDALKRNALMADIFLISTGVLATSATVLAVMTDWSRDSANPEDEGNIKVKKIGLAPTHGGGFFSIGGSF